MLLETLLESLGLAEVARRAGVTEETVLRWLKKGPSRKGEAILEGIAVRRRRALAGVPARFRARISRPKKKGSEPEPLSDEALKPTAKPPKATKAMLAELELPELRAGSHPRETKHHIGEDRWFEVSREIPKVDPMRDIVDPAIAHWKRTGRGHAYIRLLVWRYVPVNPAYNATHALYAKQGQWVQQVVTAGITTEQPTWELTREIIGDKVISLFEGVHKAMGLKQQAETRVLWLDSFMINTYDKKK